MMTELDIARILAGSRQQIEAMIDVDDYDIDDDDERELIEHLHIESIDDGSIFDFDDNPDIECYPLSE